MGYKEAVTEAAGLLVQGEAANWALARLTAENTRGDRWEEAAGLVTLKQWSADVQAAGRRRFSVTTAAHYKRMWTEYGAEYQRSKSTADPLSWTEQWTSLFPRDTGEAMRERNTDIHLREATPERRIEVTATLLRDPGVREALVAPTGPLAAAGQVLADERRERLDAEEAAAKARTEQKTTHERETNPVFSELESKRAINDLLKAANDFARAVARALPKVKALAVDGDPLQQAMWLRDANIRARGAVEQIDALVASGKPGGDVDAFVTTVLRSARAG